MNTKAVPILFFIFSFALAGSITFNIIQYSNTQDPAVRKAQANLLLSVKDIRRTGTVLENNPSEGWLVVTSTTISGEKEKLKTWVVPGATIVRSQAQTDPGGIVDTIEARFIEQKDLKVGEPIFILVQNSSERKRLEMNTAWVGQLLPYSK